jgi:hypothetical protein
VGPDWRPARYHAITTMQRRAFVAGLLSSAAVLCRQRTALAYASSTPPVRANYVILIDGRDSGRHSVTVATDGGRCVATIVSKADIRFLAIPLFVYEHVSREDWEGDSLVGFESRTEDNGRSFRVEGRSTSSGFRVDVGGRLAMLPQDVAPATYWNRSILERPHVLDPEDGRLFRHQVGSKRITALDWMAGSSEATEVDVTSFTSGVVWYGTSGRFLGCRFRKDGHAIEFRALPG